MGVILSFSAHVQSNLSQSSIGRDWLGEIFFARGSCPSFRVSFPHVLQALQSVAAAWRLTENSTNVFELVVGAGAPVGTVRDAAGNLVETTRIRVTFRPFFVADGEYWVRYINSVHPARPDAPVTFDLSSGKPMWHFYAVWFPFLIVFRACFVFICFFVSCVSIFGRSKTETERFPAQNIFRDSPFFVLVIF